MYKNKTLRGARVGKYDEFYTQYNDIEREVLNYKSFFKGKTVYCNCDDADKSNFVKYFVNSFNELELKCLVSTEYVVGGNGKFFSYNGGGNPINRLLNGDGDFRSEECVKLLDECDVVVTNPPFSLFREYVSMLFEHEKSFLVIGNMNAITYKEIFPLIKNNKMWWGCSTQ